MKIITWRMKISFIKQKFRSCRINLKHRLKSKSKLVEGDRVLITITNITIKKVTQIKL